MYYVYIIQSIVTKRYYVGSTPDFKKRLTEHNTGITKSTKPYRPYTVVHIEKLQSKHDALKREKQIKRYKGGNAFKKLLKIE